MQSARRNFVIVPVCCGRMMTRRAIASALAQDIGNIEVIAIDNGSTDGCGALLRSLPVSYWYRTERSLNAVWNEALRWVLDRHDQPFALVINNDVELRPDTYSLLAEDGGLFVTGVSVSERSATTHANPRSKSPHPSFSCFLIRQECWRRTGEFDEKFWAWASDGDYHLRMDAQGIDAWSLDIPFYHEVSGTLKQIAPEKHEVLCRLSDHDRAYFKEKWGCTIGSDEYYERFRHKRLNRYEMTGRLDG